MNQSESQHPDFKPWFREFWPWFVIAIPVVSVVVGISMIIIASRYGDALVVDNYYKSGLAINQTLEQQKNAAKLNIHADASFDPDAGEIRITVYNLGDQEPLRLSIVHATKPGMDLFLTLQHDTGNVYRVKTSDLQRGRWYLMLEPDNKNWRIDATVTIPDQLHWKMKPIG